MRKQLFANTNNSTIEADMLEDRRTARDKRRPKVKDSLKRANKRIRKDTAYLSQLNEED